MDRREALKLFALSSVLPAIPGELFAACREIHASLASTPQLKVLNPHQDATVTAMAELMIPETETPGAKAARVNEFIDHILADWYSDEERVHFLAGLAAVDASTQNLFGKDFVGVSTAQQSEILYALGEEMAREAAALAAAPRGYRGSAREPGDNFYFRFRDLTLTGYFTSEIGAVQQLHEEIIPGHYDGCTPLAPPVQRKNS